MKKLIALVMVGLLGSLTLKAQEKFSTYKSEYFEKTYDVQLGKIDKKGEFTFYIDAAPQDDTRMVSMMLKTNEYTQFITALNEAKSTYEKWVKTAKDNNVTELSKEIPVKFPAVSAAFMYGEWKFDFFVKITPRFKILKGDYLLIIASDELVSSSNQFMKSDGFYLVFKSGGEIESFVKAIDQVKATEFLKSKSSKDDLFN